MCSPEKMFAPQIPFQALCGEGGLGVAEGAQCIWVTKKDRRV